jgi:hypothetical protein
LGLRVVGAQVLDHLPHHGVRQNGLRIKGREEPTADTQRRKVQAHTVQEAGYFSARAQELIRTKNYHPQLKNQLIAHPRT